MSNTKTDILFILDESGSMNCMGDEPINSVNQFIESQKEIDSKNTNITIVKFNDKVNTIVNKVPIDEFKGLTKNDYTPDCTTSLYDAIVSTIKTEIDEYEEKEESKKIFVIITDGAENTSRTYSLTDVKEYVHTAENTHGWKIIFCGANIDSFETGSSMKMSKTRCANFDQSIPGNLFGLCRSISDCVSDYRQNKTKELTLRSFSAPVKSTTPTESKQTADLDRIPPLPSFFSLRL